MRADIYEIIPCPKGRLATMPRPRGGDWLQDELESLKAMGVSDLVSMLTLSEENELELTLESQLCDLVGIKFHRHSVLDRGLPLQPDFDRFVASLLPVLSQNGFIAIHCRAGIGRSSVTAAALLCRLGIAPLDAIAHISRARGMGIPDTEEQRSFILNLDAI